MSGMTPLASSFPLKPLRFMAPLRGEKVDVVPVEGEFLGLEQFESWSGRLSGVELQQPPEGGANIFNDGDVLFGKLRPYLAKGWVAENSGYCTTESLVLTPSDADPRFVRYCLLTHEVISAVDGSTYGSKMPRADWGFIGGIHLPCPAKDQQICIANFLDDKTARIDALIAEKERLLVAVEEIACSSLAHEMAGGLGAAESTHYEWYPKLPKGWRVLPFKTAVQFTEGPGIMAVDFRDEGIPLLRVSSVRNATATLDGCNFLDPQKVDKTWRHFRVKRGDLLISASASMGTVSLVTDETEGAVPYTGIIILRPIAGMVTREFLGNFVLSDQFIRQIDVMKAGATIQHYGPTHLNRLMMAVPYSLDEQVAVSKRLDEARIKHDSLKVHVEEHIARLREYRSSLISAAVTGQLDIGTVEGAHRRLLENVLPA